MEIFMIWTWWEGHPWCWSSYRTPTQRRSPENIHIFIFGHCVKEPCIGRLPSLSINIFFRISNIFQRVMVTCVSRWKAVSARPVHTRWNQKLQPDSHRMAWSFSWTWKIFVCVIKIFGCSWSHLLPADAAGVDGGCARVGRVEDHRLHHEWDK